MLFVIGQTHNTTSILFSASMFIIFTYIINYIWQRRWLYYHISKMSGPFAWPIVGNALQFVGGSDELLETVMSQIRKYKPIYRFWLGNRPYVFVTNPNDVETVLNKALEKGENYHILKNVLGNGLVTAPLVMWKKHRKMINPSFNQRILNSFVDKFVKQGKVLIRRLGEQSEPTDIYQLLYTCTLDQIAETVIGYQVNAQSEDNEYARWITRSMEIMYDRAFKIWQHPNVLWKINPISKEFDKILKNIKAHVERVVRDLDKNFKNENDLGNPDIKESFSERTFIRILETNGNDWDKDQIFDEVLTMLTAGSETSASTDAFVLIMIGMHSKVQEKLYAEQCEIFGNNLDELTAADLPEMKYLERVIKETLRLFPLAPIIFRSITEDIKLGNFVLPKGSSCGISSIAIHRDPDYWSEPLKFDPDRFLPEEIAKLHPYCYIPFSAGPRNCIGINYAMMSMKTLLSMIVRNFIVTTEYKTVEEVKLKAECVLKCANGYKVALRRRP